MRFLKTYIGSLIISVGVLFVIGIVFRAAGLKLPEIVTSHLLETWLVTAIIVYPFARKVVRV